MKHLSAILLLTLLSCWTSDCSAQFNFQTNTTGNQAADDAFFDAAKTWADEFNDDMTLFVDYSFANLDQNVLATTLNTIDSYSFTDFRTAIGNDITSNDDATMVNALPTGTSFSLYINQTSEASGSSFEIPYVDNDGGANNSTVQLTSANAKSLGLIFTHAPVVDGVIVFSNSVQWDYDASDGIEAGHVDFIAVALHEIGHALGFESGVDQLDGNGGGQISDDQLSNVTSLDFLRFSDDSEVAGADIDWTADQRAKYFSINGGLTPAASGSSHWSTGETYGDGQQASHWKDGMNLGIMDPTSESSMNKTISANDLLAFDAIGYNLIGTSSVPEPGSLAILALFSGLLLRRRRV